jgi:PAS domain S-box-containing protein
MSDKTLRAERAELLQRLKEAEDTLRAIREGAVDAVMVQEAKGHRVYTLEGADRPYRLFVEQMQQGAATLHADATIAYSNQRLADLLKVPLEKLIGARLTDFMRADERPVYEALAAQGRSGSASGEATLCAADRTNVPVLLTFNLLPSDSGVGVGVLITDLTSQRHHELVQSTLDRLQESEERFRLLISVITDVPWTTDAEGRFAVLQPAWATYTGQMWEQYRDFGWADALHPEDREQVTATWRRACETRGVYESRGRLWHQATGSWRHFVAHATPRIGPEGRVREWVGTYTDVQQAKQAEEALRESEAHLREANRIKDEFLATLSHELRTPLNAVLGWSDLMRDGTLPPDTQRRALDSVVRNAKAQAQLVDDLLDISRIVSGKLEIKRETVDVAAVIAAAVETVRVSATAKDISLSVSIDPGSALLVHGDPDRLQQVVWNLLTNAIKFTPTGGRVDVRARRIDSVAEILVTDSGQGIAEEFVPHVFERFRQADSTHARKHAGLGLGLAIVRHLVEAHGGTVAADSQGQGQGSTFIVRLPICVAARPLPPVPRIIGEARAALIDARVLVVDDDADARDVLRAALEGRGAQVTSVSSAGEAMYALQRSSFNVLLCDVGMPGEDGYALIQAVRALPPDQGGRIPAVAVTAYATVRDRDEAMKSGFNLHLAKPVDLDQMIAFVSSATTDLSRPPSARDATP